MVTTLRHYGAEIIHLCLYCLVFKNMDINLGWWGQMFGLAVWMPHKTPISHIGGLGSESQFSSQFKLAQMQTLGGSRWSLRWLGPYHTHSRPGLNSAPGPGLSPRPKCCGHSRNEPEDVSDSFILSLSLSLPSFNLCLTTCPSISVSDF